MPSDDSSKRKRMMAMAIGALILLVILVVYFHGSADDDASAFSVGGAVHEITSLPDQTLSLYNKVAPAKMRLGAAGKAKKAKKGRFVGAFGRTPEMQHCLDFDSSGDRTTAFNRCTWV